jgi:hypothetical protein
LVGKLDKVAGVQLQSHAKHALKVTNYAVLLSLCSICFLLVGVQSCLYPHPNSVWNKELYELFLRSPGEGGRPHLIKLVTRFSAQGEKLGENPLSTRLTLKRTRCAPSFFDEQTSARGKRRHQRRTSSWQLLQKRARDGLALAKTVSFLCFHSDQQTRRMKHE